MMRATWCPTSGPRLRRIAFAPSGKRQTGGLLPPLTKIDYAMQVPFPEKQLTFVDQQAGFHFLCAWTASKILSNGMVTVSTLGSKSFRPDRRWSSFPEWRFCARRDRFS